MDLKGAIDRRRLSPRACRRRSSSLGSKSLPGVIRRDPCRRSHGRGANDYHPNAQNGGRAGARIDHADHHVRTCRAGRGARVRRGRGVPLPSHASRSRSSHRHGRPMSRRHGSRHRRGPANESRRAARRRGRWRQRSSMLLSTSASQFGAIEAPTKVKYKSSRHYRFPRA